ncbi:hypothetical protein G6F57_004689 [Rhizopus arrhizus]|uniref:Uncharacterized protein n=1 Tax=Rhizopus oryzae TaxID=64495 RepID=A0A9P6XCM2_RHIOR|nr:hypothetical protein G6F23_006546 [Rhizopus arrhizus]KAG1426539.1 hypothetical protein G6F58_001428 [Rhizopus delemar]KAG0765522.1 hypothetical protein G6F24_004355 [Rhizopus arrhizus]KAG0792186.1 hypothetical protein G6F21_004539 [Rhizopus arrhizus]KAG0802375.1 hypothetical protein G6F22_000317 [Rhizopus arrhizus]
MSNPPKPSFTPTKVLELVPDHPLIRKHIPPDRTSNASMWSSEDSSLDINTRTRQGSLDVNRHAQRSKPVVSHPSKSAESNWSKNKGEQDDVRSGWGAPVSQDSINTSSSIQSKTDITMGWGASSAQTIPSDTAAASVLSWSALPVQSKQEGASMITENRTEWNISTNQPTPEDVADASANDPAWDVPDTQIAQENTATAIESVLDWRDLTDQSRLVQPAATIIASKSACGEHEDIYGGWCAPSIEPNVAHLSQKNEATCTQDTSNLTVSVKNYHEPNYSSSLQNEDFKSPAELLKGNKEQKEMLDISDKAGGWADYKQGVNLDHSLEKLTRVHKQEKNQVQVDFNARDTLNEDSKTNVVKDVSDEIGSNNLADKSESVHVKPQKLNEGFRFKVEVDRNVYTNLVLYKDSNVFEVIDGLEKTQNIRMENKVKAKLAMAIMRNIAMKIYNVEKKDLN